MRRLAPVRGFDANGTAQFAASAMLRFYAIEK
jgi:hypothetical protein